MPKRLADTEIWNKDWFLELSLKQKLLVKFLFDNCDCAGVYKISYRNLKNCFGEEVTKEDFFGIKQVKFIDDNTIFIEDFINFQYLTPDRPYLNPNNKAHLGVIRRLIKNNIDYTKYLSPFKGASKPLQRGTGIGIGIGVGIGKGIGSEKEGVLGGGKTNELQEDENEVSKIEPERKAEYNEQEKKPSCGELSEENQGISAFKRRKTPVNPDIYFINHTEYFKTYARLCPDLAPLSFERRNAKVLQTLEKFRKEIDDDVGKFREICIKANKLRFIAKNKIDFLMLLNCYLGILNGKYASTEEQSHEIDTKKILKEALGGLDSG